VEALVNPALAIGLLAAAFVVVFVLEARSYREDSRRATEDTTRPRAGTPNRVNPAARALAVPDWDWPESRPWDPEAYEGSLAQAAVERAWADIERREGS
jgi:hypothetical protein